jgi:S-adenosyl-L-methionine hydrolase (adenosine-forming)
MARIITLLSDFGTEDVYVGVLKGVIAQIAPQVTVVDLTHQIPPQNVSLASFQLAMAQAHFPAGTVHLAIVDPGVGGSRRGIAFQTATGYFVGPDNGLFSGILATASFAKSVAVELTNSQFWYNQQPSPTFHGRDIFAAVAAHLANGVHLRDFGPAIPPTRLLRLPVRHHQQTETGFAGTIQAIDRFGNLITTLPSHCVGDQAWTINVAGKVIPGVRTYSDRPYGAMIGLIGSHGWLEIAVNCGNAQVALGLGLNDPVQVMITKQTDSGGAHASSTG